MATEIPGNSSAQSVGPSTNSKAPDKIDGGEIVRKPEVELEVKSNDRISNELSTNEVSAPTQVNKPVFIDEKSINRVEQKKDQVVELEHAVSRVSGFVQNIQRDLVFSVDEGSGETIIQVIDSETDTLVRQIPRDEMLKLAEQLQGPEGVLIKFEV